MDQRTKFIQQVHRELFESGFKVGEIEYTSCNYDEKGHIIDGVIPTVTSDFGEIGLHHKEFYFVLIFEKKYLNKNFLYTIGAIRKFKLYGFQNFKTNMSVDESLSNSVTEQFIQIQFDGVKQEESVVIVSLHKTLKTLFDDYNIYPVNQLNVDLKASNINGSL